MRRSRRQGCGLRPSWPFRGSPLAPLVLLIGASFPGAASAQPEYDAHVVEPWDASYQFATSTIGDLNDLNVAVGSAYFEGTTTARFLWTPEDGKMAADVGGSHINNSGVTAAGSAIYWSPGVYELIPHPGGGAGIGIRDLSNQNVVCGTAGISERTLAFVWDATNGSRYLEDLGVPPTTWRAYAINDAGLLAGSRSLTGEPGDEKSFVLDVPAERYIDLHGMLNPSGTGITRAVDVSDNGNVAGEGSYNDGSDIAGFLWSEAAGFTFLPGLGGGRPMDVHPRAVNSEGTLVGAALDGGLEWRAFIWNADYGLRDLEDLATLPAGFNLEEAKAINENGWIVARGFWGQAWGPERAVVFVPRGGTTAVADAASVDSGPIATVRVAPDLAGAGARVAFRLPAASAVRLGVYDVLGRSVAVLIDGSRAAGQHIAHWDGATAAGRRTAGGVYFVRLVTDRSQVVERFVRLP
ncbi:MAG: FlgD immunoglobulin-like domain containing protein [Candidatus Eiseniibacteriota bacterium]